MKTIRQLSEELKISKEALYKKLKHQLNDQLEGHVVKIGNVTHVDEEGERLIAQSINRERQEALYGVLEADPSDYASSVPAHIREHVSILRDQIKAKDAQIDAQNGHIGLLIRQLGNNQLLTQAERIKSLTSREPGPEGLKPPRPRPIPFWRNIFKNRSMSTK